MSYDYPPPTPSPYRAPRPATDPRTLSIVVGGALLASATLLVIDYAEWIDLPQPASLLIAVLLILAAGVIYEGLRGRRSTGLLVTAVIVGALAIPATGREVSDGSWGHDHGWHRWGSPPWHDDVEESAETQGLATTQPTDIEGVLS